MLFRCIKDLRRFDYEDDIDIDIRVGDIITREHHVYAGIFLYETQEGQPFPLNQLALREHFEPVEENCCEV